MHFNALPLQMWDSPGAWCAQECFEPVLITRRFGNHLNTLKEARAIPILL